MWCRELGERGAVVRLLNEGEERVEKTGSEVDCCWRVKGERRGKGLRWEIEMVLWFQMNGRM